MTNNNQAKKELEKIYDSNFRANKIAKTFRKNFLKTLRDNPKLNLILKLLFLANIGIWLTLFITISKFY